MKPVSEKKAYEAVCEVFRHSRGGITAADLAAKTALPLAVVKEAAPKAADEYNGSLSVTESGEILYSFRHGFKSRHRGAGVFLKKVLAKLGKGLVVFGKWAFKVWIMLMLVGYFAFFMLLALAALLLSVAGNSSNESSSRRSGDGAIGLVGGLFNMIIRLWFYSELLNMDRNYGRSSVAKPRGRPLHKAIFSYVFGDGDPNATIEQRHKTAVIAFIQANKGVINLEEYIAITGKTPFDADREITAFCAEFGGSPEVTDGGTIVYRFDDLLLKTETSARFVTVPYGQLLQFSGNTKKMNSWFAVINTVNLLFGGYFIYNSLIPQTGGTTLFNYLYRVAYILIGGNTPAAQTVLLHILGVVPLVFSLLFWVIPIVRKSQLKKHNEGIKLENLRKIGVRHVYTAPLSVKPAEIKSSMAEAAPANLAKAQDTIIKELSFFGSPDITAEESGEMVYSFAEIKRDKEATGKYRDSINSDKSGLGKVVFEA
jgi:hypothetical protein